MKYIIERHPVLSYFLMVYVLTWGGILLLAQAFAVQAEPASAALIGIVALPMLLAPGITGVAITALADGRAGLQALWARMTHWRVEARWYGVGLAMLPLLLLTILSILTLLISPAFAPALSLMGLAGLAAGFLEEIGWTGFVVPRLRSRWSLIRTGLIVGLLWGLWHGMADYAIRGSEFGTFWPITFGLFVLPVMAWRVLMVWVYDHTKSGPVAQLMHFSYTGSLAMFIPALSMTDDALVYAVLAGALWALVVIIVVAPGYLVKKAPMAQGRGSAAP